MLDTTPRREAGWGSLDGCPFSFWGLGWVSRRSIVYVDGFNLYYGALRGGAYKWLNLERFFKTLRTDDDVQHIYFFTAVIEGSHVQSQISYLRALETLPLVSVVFGRFKMKRVPCRIPECQHVGYRFFNVPEEKRTDVNIALQMLQDVYQDQCDISVLVSGDSDLVPAVTHVKATFPEKTVVVYVPSRNPIRGAAVELRAVADRHRILPLNLLKHCQLPREIPTASGVVRKPADW